MTSNLPNRNCIFTELPRYTVIVIPASGSNSGNQNAARKPQWGKQDSPPPKAAVDRPGLKLPPESWHHQKLNLVPARFSIA
jgi:hypothetical protein